MRIYKLIALTAVLASSGAIAQTWNSRGGPEFTSMAQRVTSVHRADMVRNAGSILERQIYGIPGMPANPAGLPAGSVTVTDKWKGPSPRFGDVIDVQAKRVIPWGSVARGISRALPLVSTALVIKELLDEVRCRERFGSGGECDLGVPPTLQERVCTAGGNITSGQHSVTGQNWLVTGPVCAATAALVEQAIAGSMNGQVPALNATPLGAGSMVWEVRFNNGFITSVGGQLSPVSGLACSAIQVNGVWLVPLVGTDGKCPTEIYEPQTLDEVRGRIEDHGSKTRAPNVVGAADGLGVPLDHPVPLMTPPGVIVGGRETTELPDGRTQTRDRDFITTPEIGGYRWEDRITERFWPPGVTPTPQGTPPPAGSPAPTVTQNPGAGAAPISVQIETCGLPGKPACKIDETGTPTDTLPDPAAAVETATTGIRACIADPMSCFPAFPTLSWGFALPTACGPIPLPAFAPYMQAIDICEFQPMFHEIMAIVWQLGGLFGAISMFWRKVFSGGP